MRPYPAFAAVMLMAITSSAALYQDSVGDIPDTYYTQLDITSVNVSDNGTALKFVINLQEGSGGFYMIGIDSVPGSGATTGTGWGTAVSMSSGMDYFIGAAPGGTDFYSWNGSAWARRGTVPVVMESDSSSRSITINLSDLNSPSKVNFDVFSGHGVDYAVDALSAVGTIPEQSAYNTGLNYSTYDLAAVPEPAHYGLICACGLLGVALLQRRRERP